MKTAAGCSKFEKVNYLCANWIAKHYQRVQIVEGKGFIYLVAASSPLIWTKKKSRDSTIWHAMQTRSLSAQQRLLLGHRKMIRYTS